MSLHFFEHLTYSEEDWIIMESAHVKACELLGHLPASYEHNERLVQTIMELFDEGTDDYQILAAVAAHREAVMIRLLATRH